MRVVLEREKVEQVEYLYFFPEWLGSVKVFSPEVPIAFNVNQVYGSLYPDEVCNLVHGKLRGVINYW